MSTIAPTSSTAPRSAPPRRLGLIAGEGRLPIITAEGMRRAGAEVCCVGLHGQFHAELPERCDRFGTAGIAQLGRWVRLLKRWGVTEAAMVGRVDKTRMHRPLAKLRQIPDWRAAVVWYRRLRHDRRNAALLAAVTEELARSGITLIDTTQYIPDHLASPGTLGSIEPGAEQRADIDFGWPLLEQTVELDIGQSIAVRERDVIAVEAVEGTDRMIDRAGELCRAKGWVLLKTAKRGHDRRADVPSVGVGTIERLSRCGGKAMALGVGRVILIDRPAVIAAADRAGIALIGVEP